MPLDLHLTCVYCREICDDDYIECAPMITAHPLCDSANGEAKRHIQRLRDEGFLDNLQRTTIALMLRDLTAHYRRSQEMATRLGDGRESD